MKYIIGLLAILLPILAGAQSQPIKALTIGDTVPDITISNVYNYPASTIHLSDLKGKLVILDFWATWCSACLQSFPKMEALQKQFGEKLQIILVNTYKGDSIQKVKSVINKMKLITGESLNLKLPYSLLQSSLAIYFPYRYVPNYVWINKDGMIMAITSETEITQQNIQKIIDGENVTLHTKKDNLTFDSNKPLFVNANGGNGDEFLYRSVITPYKEGLGYAVGHADEGKISRFYAINQPLSALLELAFPQEMALPANRRYYTGDSAAILKSKISSEERNNSYCYEIILPVVSHATLMHCIHEDMVRFFGIIAQKEMRKIPCYLLQAPNPDKISYSPYSVPLAHYTAKYDHKFMKGVAVSFAVSVLNNLLNCPLIDQTGIKKPVDIELPKNLTDQKALIMALKKAGFTLTASQKEMEVTVITHQPFSPKNDSK